ncbi:MAG: 50S ribosomal protein L3 [Deinococcota bacterium]|jgi:large subunit ribosomal protein L3|nr:50S ribosomal protein L3 [Deinococcota bacterium]
MKGILGTKVGMTQIWQGDRLVPVTVVVAGPCPVVQRKTVETDGYKAVQLGWVEKRAKAANKPELGHAKKAGVAVQRHLVELRDYDPEGDAVTVGIFEPGQKVDVTGTTKGRGTAGVMKRWNFRGMGASHGVKKKHRHPGSIGQRKTPGRVYKGKRMAGHYGTERVTTIGLELLEVRPDDNLLLIKGALPGASGSLVVVKDSTRGAR